MKPTWLDRLFNEIEQAHIRKAPNPLLTAWQIWAIKEAAFKAWAPVFPSVRFKPLSYQVTFNHTPTQVNYVQRNGHLWASPLAVLQAKWYESHLLAIVGSPTITPSSLQKGTVDLSIEADYRTRQKALYSGFLAHLSQAMPLQTKDLTLIPRRRNLPYLSYQNRLFPLIFSLSHDQSIGMWAFLTPS